MLSSKERWSLFKSSGSIGGAHTGGSPVGLSTVAVGSGAEACTALTAAPQETVTPESPFMTVGGELCTCISLVCCG